MGPRLGVVNDTRLAGEGHHVIAGARREDRLAALVERGAGRISARRLDVTDRADVAAFVEDAVTVRALSSRSSPTPSPTRWRPRR